MLKMTNRWDHRPDLVAPLGGLGLAGRELFESSSSESVDSGESTTEPSVVSVSPRSSGVSGITVRLVLSLGFLLGLGQ